MKYLQNILVGLAVLVGIVCFVYGGLWLGFIGGIVQIFEGLKATPINSLAVALGITRWTFGPALGWCFLCLFGYISQKIYKLKL